MKINLVLQKKPLRILGGIFDKNKIELKLKELNETLSKENFWKDKKLVSKTVKQKKIFDDILNSYQVSLNEIKNLKDLYQLAIKEKDEETIEDCKIKINQIFSESKKNEIRCFLSEK